MESAGRAGALPGSQPPPSPAPTGLWQPASGALGALAAVEAQQAPQAKAHSAAKCGGEVGLLREAGGERCPARPPPPPGLCGRRARLLEEERRAAESLTVDNRSAGVVSPDVLGGPRAAGGREETAPTRPKPPGAPPIPPPLAPGRWGRRRRRFALFAGGQPGACWSGAGSSHLRDRSAPRFTFSRKRRDQTRWKRRSRPRRRHVVRASLPRQTQFVWRRPGRWGRTGDAEHHLPRTARTALFAAA